MAEPTSARVPGHTLNQEGLGRDDDGIFTQHWGTGSCRCGAESPVLPSNRQRKGWFRQHKADVLAAPPRDLMAALEKSLGMEPHAARGERP